MRQVGDGNSNVYSKRSLEYTCCATTADVITATKTKNAAGTFRIIPKTPFPRCVTMIDERCVLTVEPRCQMPVGHAPVVLQGTSKHASTPVNYCCLCTKQFGNAFTCQNQKVIHLCSTKRLPLSRALHFNKPPIAGAHHVHIYFGSGVFVIL